MICALAAAAGAANDLPDALNPGARLPAGSAASEYWDLAAHFGSAHRVYARFLITNEGPGERNGVAIGHVIFPDGSVTEFRNGRREDRWTLGPQRRRLEVGSSVLDLATSTRHLQVNKKKKGIRIRLDWAVDATAAHLPGPDGAAYHVDLLNLGTPITGSLWVRGMEAPVSVEGRAVLTHTWIERKERKVVLRRIDVATLDGATAFFLSDLTSPKGDRSRSIAVADGSGIVDVSHTVAPAPIGEAVSNDGYPVPASIPVASRELNGSITLGEPVLRHDPLDALPLALRMVYSFRARPHRIWMDAEVDLAPEHVAVPIRGTGVATLTFLDSLPSK